MLETQKCTRKSSPRKGQQATKAAGRQRSWGGSRTSRPGSSEKCWAQEKLSREGRGWGERLIGQPQNNKVWKRLQRDRRMKGQKIAWLYKGRLVWFTNTSIWRLERRLMTPGWGSCHSPFPWRKSQANTQLQQHWPGSVLSATLTCHQQLRLRRALAAPREAKTGAVPWHTAFTGLWFCFNHQSKQWRWEPDPSTHHWPWLSTSVRWRTRRVHAGQGEDSKGLATASRGAQPCWLYMDRDTSAK